MEFAKKTSPSMKGGLHSQKETEIMGCKFHMKLANDNVKTKNLEFLVEEEVTDLKGNPERYAGIYRELAELLGESAVNKIWKNYSGTNVAFPQRLFSKEYTREFIASHWDDMTAAEIARVVGLSERRVRQIASEIKRKEGE